MRCESPFSAPQPVFQSPRNLQRLLTQPAKRNWFKPAQVVVNPRCEGYRTIPIFNGERSKTPVFYSGGFGVAGRRSAPQFTSSMTLRAGCGRLASSALDSIGPISPKARSVYDRDISPMFACGSASYARNAVKRGIPAYAYVRRSTFATKSTIFWTTEWPILRDSGVNVNCSSTVLRAQTPGFHARIARMSCRE